MLDRQKKQLLSGMKNLIYFYANALVEEKGNFKIIYRCIKDSIEITDYIKNEENVIEHWKAAALEGIFHYCYQAENISYELPAAIKRILGIHDRQTEQWCLFQKENYYEYMINKTEYIWNILFGNTDSKKMEQYCQTIMEMLDFDRIPVDVNNDMATVRFQNRKTKETIGFDGWELASYYIVEKAVHSFISDSIIIQKV